MTELHFSFRIGIFSTDSNNIIVQAFVRMCFVGNRQRMRGKPVKKSRDWVLEKKERRRRQGK